ncbi:MAG: ParB/RepB/Spo0J family partition protein [Rhizonema sp. PD38]|nr:ParB/RepB/Spo0J family partition protein [Rhizonema sp. PD38]
MNNRRQLKDAISDSEELSFVFGQSTTQNFGQTAAATKEQLIPSHSIICTFTFVPDGKPVRHYYDLIELQKWANDDIKSNGIRSPLWVRLHPSLVGKYELVAGLRRLKAAEILGLDTVPVKVFDWDDRTAFHAAISENTSRRDFSALEELDNTLRFLECQMGYNTEEVVSFLYRMNNATKGSTNQNVLVSTEAEIVQQVFNSLGGITWQSFVATRLPMLKKPLDILNAIRLGKIHYTKGILIASIKDEDVRRNLLEESINHSLSLSVIKERVKALNGTTKAPSKPISLKQRLTLTVQMAKKNQQLWNDPDKTQKLEQLLSQLEAIVMN